MRKYIHFTLYITLFFNFFQVQAQTKLTHNSCDIVKTIDHSCSSAVAFWARDFYLNQFEISNQEQFIITKGEVAFSYTTWKANIQFNIYEIDNNFPNSFSNANLIGSSQVEPLPIISNGNIQTVTVNFVNPIIVPQGVDRILVEVKKGIEYGSALAHIAGSTQDNGISWYKGCIAGWQYINSDQISNSQWPGSDYNFYINVEGNVINPNEDFSLNYTKDCSQTTKEFHLNNISQINSLSWDFGDPASGSNNVSNQINPTHDFSSSGQYLVTVTILKKDGTVSTLTQTINVAQPPIAHPINDVYACENMSDPSYSLEFNTANIESQLINGQTGVIVNYYDENGNELPTPLPNPFTNTLPSPQVIIARISNSSDLCCYSETSFSLITMPLPGVVEIDSIFACDNNNDGFAAFSLNDLEIDIINGQSNLDVQFYNSNNDIISENNLESFTNLNSFQDFVIAVITDSNQNCTSEISVNLIVKNPPIINALPVMFGCDDNNDGISEYFNFSNIESEVINGQSNMIISYFNQNGVELPSPLPNPYTNTQAFHENITIRVTNENTGCYSETILELQTSSQPDINQPDDIYACDTGNGFANFNTSELEEQIIGNQTNLEISFFDSNNNPLPSPLPVTMQNTEPYSQTLYAKVEDQDNPACYSETSFDLMVNELPQVELKNQYSICDLDPSIKLEVNSDYNSYEWYFENNELIANTYQAEIIEEGKYTLIVTYLQNGVECENSFSFELVRSELPQIEQVNYGELGNNFIEIIASGDGELEYSIDGRIYQDNNYFENVVGGDYMVYVRDKDGCGKDSKSINIIDYPKFFTPNNDGYNDYWKIKGLDKYPQANIYIFDRFGKLLVQLPLNMRGWDGYYNGKKMPSNDYWFKVSLGNEKSFSGHFTLKR